MFVVRFVRKDDLHDEEYLYHKFEDAQMHFHLFDEDDSELYQNICLFEEKSGELILIDEHPPP